MQEYRNIVTVKQLKAMVSSALSLMFLLLFCDSMEIFMKINLKFRSVFFSVLFSCMIILVFIIILPKLILYVSSIFGITFDRKDLYLKYIFGTIVRILGILASLLIMSKAKILRNIRFKWNNKYLFFGLLFIIYIIINISFVSISSDKIPLAILMILSCLCVGIFEEVVFRGLALGMLLKAWNKSRKEIYFSVIISSLLFGLVHIQNYLSGNAELLTTLCQIGYSTCIGVMLSAILIRCDFSLWWCSILHALFNIANDFEKVASYNVVSNAPSINSVNYLSELLNMLLFLPLFIFGLLILRKVKTIDENFNVN